MPRQKAPPIDAYTLAAFRFGVMLLEDYRDSRTLGTVEARLDLSPGELAVILLGQDVPKEDSRPMVLLGAWLMYFARSHKQGSKEYDELWTTASALVSERGWKRVLRQIDQCQRLNEAWLRVAGVEPPAPLANTQKQQEVGGTFDDPGDVFGEEWKLGTDLDPRRHTTAPKPPSPPPVNEAEMRRVIAKVIREILDALERDQKQG